jgi:hypothetical protein
MACREKVFVEREKNYSGGNGPRTEDEKNPSEVFDRKRREGFFKSLRVVQGMKHPRERG